MRKTASLALLAALVLAAATLAPLWAGSGEAASPLAAPRNLQSQRASLPISVDGNLSDWPAVTPLYLDASQAQYTAGIIRDALDLSVSLYSAWDDTYLYFGAVITDDILVADSTNVWDDDSIEISLDGNHDGLCCSPADHQFTVTVDRRLADFGAIVQTSTGGLRVGVVMRPGGYVVEMAAPLVSLTALPIVPGTTMGANVALNDDDDGGRRDKRLVWMGNTTLDFTNLGSLIFTGTGAPQPTSTPRPTGVATATATKTPAPAATPTSVRTTTPTVTGQPTQSVDDRLVVLEQNLVTLEARLRTILEILQRAGQFPSLAGLGVGAPPAAAADPRAYVQGVNCGGDAYTTVAGDFYAADKAYAPGGWGYLSGQVAVVAQAIVNTTDETLYQSERYNLTGYAFEVPAGTYEVLLRFAETYQYAKTGGRVFDVKLEGQTVVAGLDVQSRVGQYAALDLTFTAAVMDGKLDIDFVPKVGQPSINAILVRGVGAAGPTPTPSTADRLGAAAAKLTELESLLTAILNVFSSAREGLVPTPTATTPVAATPTARAQTPTPTVTRTATRTATVGLVGATATRTATLIPPTATAIKTTTRTSTPATGGATATPHVTTKKGVGGGAQPELLRTIGVSWSYIWYIAANNFNSVYQHVPMIWGRDYDPATVTQVAGAHPGSYWLIWNEPDYWQSANISPTEAAQLYRVLRPLIKSADPTAKLIVGGVFNVNTGWLASFRSEYYRLYGEWPVVEGWHVHLYVGRTDYDSATWRTKLQAVRDWMPGNGGNVELWLTEFGCLNSDVVAAQIMADQTPWLEAQPWITRYAWYAAFASGVACPDCSGSLFNADGTLTSLGIMYRDLP